MAASDDELFQREMFLDLVRDGTPLEIAAYEVGWTPKKFERFMADEDFADLTEQHESLRDAGIENVLYAQAKRGQRWAVELVLFNRRPDRWRNFQVLKQEGSVAADLAPQIIAATAEAVRESMLAAVRSGNVAQLQALPSGQEIIDAEVIDDDPEGAAEAG